MSAVRPSVCPSVMLVDQDQISWKSWKLIARTISPISSLFRSPKAIHLLPGENGDIWGRLWGGWGKVACWSTKAAISQKRVKIEEKLLWSAYNNSPALFRTVPSSTPYTASLSPRLGFATQPKTAIAIIWGRGKAIRTANLAGTFTGSIRTKADYKFGRKWNVGVSRDCRNFFEYIPPIVSARTGNKATNFKFCTHILSVDRNKSPGAYWGTLEIFRNPYIGCTAR